MDQEGFDGNWTTVGRADIEALESIWSELCTAHGATGSGVMYRKSGSHDEVARFTAGRLRTYLWTKSYLHGSSSGDHPWSLPVALPDNQRHDQSQAGVPHEGFGASPPGYYDTPLD